MNWSLLHSNHPIIADVIQKWQGLLKVKHSESVYHEFLRRHANLFFVDSMQTYFAISKLKLGSHYELDFAVPREGYSHGLFWNLIEIKRPQDAPFTKSGAPSATLTEAAQQVRNWKRWIRESRTEAKKIFSVWSPRAYLDPNFKFTIIIGTRSNTEKWLEERNQFSEESGVTVRSFDYLTERLERRLFADSAYVGSGGWNYENQDLSVKLANPFIEAFTDSQWKEVLRSSRKFPNHFISKVSEAIVASWTPNNDLMKKFNQMKI